MTQRTIFAGENPTVVIKAGASVIVTGHDSDQIQVTASDLWGMKVEKHSEAEMARARAAIGDLVLFDLHVNRPNWGGKKIVEDVIEIQLGGSGEVTVPVGANVKIYSGANLDARGIHGRVDAYAGANLNLEDIGCLGNASAGWTMNLDCQKMCDVSAEYNTGRDLRFHVQELTSVLIRVKDIGGYWEARIGAGETKLSLKCGGDVTLVTDQAVEGLPPNYILGRIEKPATKASSAT
jgi:hypothetical protein